MAFPFRLTCSQADYLDWNHGWFLEPMCGGSDDDDDGAGGGGDDNDDDDIDNTFSRIGGLFVP